MLKRSAQDILQLIAEGYYRRCQEDRYILLDNPDFREDSGSNPLIVWDIKGDPLQ